VDRLQEIADRHGLALIYDAAHAFGVSYQGKSILDYGDASVLSLHATKVFHSVEGGAMVFKDPAAFDRGEWMRRYGHNGYDDFHGVGINAKMSELHAAMGLCLFAHLDEIYQGRKSIIDQYQAAISDMQSINLVASRLPEKPAVGYAPILFSNEQDLLRCMENLRAKQIFPRRYFCHNWDGLTQEALKKLPVYEDMRRRLLCLPVNAEFGAKPVVEVIETCESSLHLL
jgi:dTDP-4-amino-4,6-dideoxygalactose transaminase